MEAPIPWDRLTPVTIATCRCKLFSIHAGPQQNSAVSGPTSIASCFPGMAVRISKRTLQKNKIEPAIKLSSHLAQVGCRFEAQLSMKMNRRRIVGIDASDHDVLTERHRTREE